MKGFPIKVLYLLGAAKYYLVIYSIISVKPDIDAPP
jgi:hypothetical protein